MNNRFRFRNGVKVAAVAAIVLSFALTGCAPPAENTGDGGTKEMSLTVGMVGSTSDIVNPYQQEGSVSSDALFKQVYEGLVAYDGTGKIVNMLAESIEPNDAQDVWTVHLRKGVKLHNGNEFIAEDAIDSLKWMIDKKNAWQYAGNIDFLNGATFESSDDHTFTITLKKPFGLVPNMLAQARINMRSIRDASVDKPEGTGPFVIDSFTAGQQAQLHRFDDYWGQKPKISKLTLQYFTEQNAVTNAIRGGQIDVAHGVPFPEVPALKNDSNLKLLVSDTAAYPIIAMNTKETPFKDEKIRQALRLAVDRERIKTNAFGGYAQIANDFIGNNTECAPPDVPQRTQDIAGAKKLLEEAGAVGTKVELVTDGAFPGMMEMAQLIAEDGKKAGLDITVRKLDVGTFLDRWTQWPFFISFTSSPYAITAKAHFMPGGSENATWFDDAEYNKIANELYLTADPAAQCTLIAQLQKIEYERGPYLVPVFGQSITVHRANISGLENDLWGRSSYMVNNVTVG